MGTDDLIIDSVPYVNPLEYETANTTPFTRPAELPKLRLAFTPYQTEALSKLIEITNKFIAELGESLAKWAREVVDRLVSAAGQISGPLFETQLYNANDNPRWWHLYKHAKKARTRKKYRRLLMKQLLKKIKEEST